MTLKEDIFSLLCQMSSSVWKAITLYVLIDFSTGRNSASLNLNIMSGDNMTSIFNVPSCAVLFQTFPAITERK